MSSEEYLTIDELAARLKVSPKTIRNKMASGISPHPYGARFDRVLDPERSDRRELTAERLLPGKAETRLRHSGVLSLGAGSHMRVLNCSILSPEIPAGNPPEIKRRVMPYLPLRLLVIHV